eukprot:g4595.t1
MLTESKLKLMAAARIINSSLKHHDEALDEKTKVAYRKKLANSYRNTGIVYGEMTQKRLVSFNYLEKAADIYREITDATGESKEEIKTLGYIMNRFRGVHKASDQPFERVIRFAERSAEIDDHKNAQKNVEAFKKAAEMADSGKEVVVRKKGSKDHPLYVVSEATYDDEDGEDAVTL